jgi:hypothetical protein
MELPNIKTIKAKADARQLAVDWQDWASEQSLSYGELSDWQTLFEALGKRFNLTDEFRENGVI